MTFLDKLYPGNKIDKLTILTTNGAHNSKSIVTCKCDCGNIVNISVDSLRPTHRPIIKSCGCLFPKYSEPVVHNGEQFNPYIITETVQSHINKKYNRLLILRILGKRKTNAIFCLAKCDCGTEKVINLNTITSGITKSCGCYSKEILNKRLTNARTDLENTYTKNKQWKYLKYDNIQKVWHVKCVKCNRISLFSPCDAETTGCLCTKRRLNKLYSYVGTTVNWISVLEVIIPKKGITKFKCQCACGKIEEYPAYYILNKRIACCKECFSKYKSLRNGGTGIPGELKPLKLYIRSSFTSAWLNKIYKLYTTVSCVSDVKFKTSSDLEIHHLNAVSNILKKFTIKTVEDYNNLSEKDKTYLHRLLLDKSNGLPLTIEQHKQLHKELGKSPTRKQSLAWINIQRIKNNLPTLAWSEASGKYIQTNTC